MRPPGCGPYATAAGVPWPGGIEARAAQLRVGATPRTTGEVLEALKRLIGPAEMGTLFKVMALTNNDQPAPEGFA